MLVWELECVQQGGSCGSLGMVPCESREQETEFKGLGADAKWQMKVGEPTPPLAHNKQIVKQMRSSVSVYSSTAQTAENLSGFWVFL